MRFGVNSSSALSKGGGPGRIRTFGQRIMRKPPGSRFLFAPGRMDEQYPGHQALLLTLKSAGDVQSNAPD